MSTAKKDNIKIDSKEELVIETEDMDKLEKLKKLVCNLLADITVMKKEIKTLQKDIKQYEPMMIDHCQDLEIQISVIREFMSKTTKPLKEKKVATATFNADLMAYAMYQGFRIHRRRIPGLMKILGLKYSKIEGKYYYEGIEYTPIPALKK